MVSRQGRCMVLMNLPWRETIHNNLLVHSPDAQMNVRVKVLWYEAYSNIKIILKIKYKL